MKQNKPDKQTFLNYKTDFTPEEINLYKEVISEIIKAQAVVLGREVALKKALKIKGFVLNEALEVLSLTDNPLFFIQSLVNEYFLLSSDSAIRISQKAARKILCKKPDLILPDILVDFR